ncbi:hypothetical protein EW146_g1747 [Bondarzewia mesenterica]|uniref:FAD-binding domain-containing protein n=1 Tax=Bondarzewia mesenterica TaxID=1095465 RepID=A0A4S4M919_9AGAM|nr:hypothetical protein EW146_g1747 [Bondarzewia mesenterica]
MDEKKNFEVLIVGGGFGGLASAIACARQGLSVTLIERTGGPSPYGDAIGFAPNTSRIAFRWGIGDQMWERSAQGRYFNIRDGKTGKVVFREDHALQVVRFGWTSLPGHRAYYQGLFWDLAVSLGIKIRTNAKVVSYVEGGDTDLHVILESGEKISADVCVMAILFRVPPLESIMVASIQVILAADGIKSRAKKIVLGFDDPPRSSGYAIYRAFTTAEALRDDPETAHLCDGCPHTWIGEDQHTLLCTFGGPGNVTHMSFALTHKDTADAIESWNFPASIDDALEYIAEGWDPVLKKAIAKFPSCIDWKLSWRDPLPRWVSQNGRITLLGDAAHPFLPTSAQGGSQAMEDGATLGICLALSEKSPEGVRLALKVFQELRYDRVAEIQQSGLRQVRFLSFFPLRQMSDTQLLLCLYLLSIFYQLDKWHHADTSKDTNLGLASSAYYDHDAEFHALESFETAARKVLNNPSFSLGPDVLEQARVRIEGDSPYAKGASEDRKASWYGPEYEIPEHDRPFVTLTIIACAKTRGHPNAK